MDERSNIEQITDSNYRKKLADSKYPTVILFIKEFSGNCHLVEKTLKDVANNFEDSMNIYLVRAEKNPSLINDFHINDFPSLIFCKKGLIVDQIAGLISKNELSSKIFDLLKIKPSAAIKLTEIKSKINS